MAKIVREVGTIDKRLDKSSIEAMAVENAREIVNSGSYDLLKVYIALKRYETYLKALIQEIKNPAMSKAVESGLQKFDYDDARVRITKRIKWDFSMDTSWSHIDRQIQELRAQRKEREKLLKESNLIQTIDEETSEVIAEMEVPQEIQNLLYIRL